MTGRVEIVPIAADHIESFHRALDFVARERRYLAFLEAPPLEETRSFVLDIIKHGYPQWVARCPPVRWSDGATSFQRAGQIPKSRPIYPHSGVLGTGLLPAFRGQGVGRRLISRTLDAGRAFGLKRVELTVREENSSAVALYKKVGFEIEGLQRGAALVDGVFENVLFMAILF